MSLRFRRRPDHWESRHERARVLAGERIDQPIEATEEAWLNDHLAGCPECASIAAAYAAQRAELRSLRRRPPSPPRDLWARTAAAIEREAATGSRARTPARRRTLSSAIPLGAISGVLVIAVVVAASLLSRPVSGPSIVAPTTAAISPVATGGSPVLRPTPFDVAAANVGWMKLGADGTIEVYDTPVDRVCPAGEGADCPPIDEPTPRSIQLGQAPASVTRSPKDQGLVVVDSDTKSNGGGVYVLPGTNAPTAAPSATPVESAPPASPSQVATEPPSTEPSIPPASVEPTASGVDTSGSEAPSIEPASPPPSQAPTPSASVRVTASPTTGAIEIASDVIVVGESEAYSPEGTWFAFSARPADGTQGPDIYLWRPGDAKASAITTDHSSMFSGWLGTRILGSRGVATADALKLVPQAFLIEPATRVELALANSRIWRPSVDPLRRVAVYWDGSLERDATGTELRPADGHLVLGGWTGALASAATPAPSPSASESAPPPSDAAASPSDAAESAAPTPTDTASASPVAESATPAPASPSATREQAIQPVELASGSVRDWDARWDETGTHLAVWIATEGDPRIGDLTLYSVDPASGKVVTLKRVAALAGFSIGKGRLAWATPRGQDGQGNRVQVVAWTKDSVGSVESRESTEVLVVIR
jgi:hypothetical protein